ncbi:hypothetical protein A2U01_0077226, partial [Trifolium medium]|nr:hypothetical protein [Trifolium medium]
VLPREEILAPPSLFGLGAHFAVANKIVVDTRESPMVAVS